MIEQQKHAGTQPTVLLFVAYEQLARGSSRRLLLIGRAGSRCVKRTTPAGAPRSQSRRTEQLPAAPFRRRAAVSALRAAAREIECLPGPEPSKRTPMPAGCLIRTTTKRALEEGRSGAMSRTCRN